MSLADDLAESLTDLTDEELRALQTRVNFLVESSASTSTRKSKKASQADFLHGVVDHFMKERFLAFPTLRVIKQGAYGKQWKQGAEEVLPRYFEKAWGAKTVKDRLAAARFCVKALLTWIEESGMAVTTNTVLMNLPKIPGVVDSYFPGYRANGLLPGLISGRYKGAVPPSSATED